MGDMMTFPASVEEFMEQYKMTDTEHVYSNGTEYVPIYRMKQWFEHCRNHQLLTIDAVPVVHGRWIASHDNFCACSICKYPVYFVEAGWNQTNYCPNCGAKMDGGDDNG